MSWDTSPTWGTAAGNRAGRVLDILEAGPTVYVAGDFTAMVPPRADAGGQKVARSYLAALSADNGELTPWDPAPDGPVRALALSPDQRRLYVGGSFAAVGGQPARHLAAVDPATGALDPGFSPPKFDGAVRALLLHGGRLYVGGSFSSVRRADGTVVPRHLLAALDPGTGALLEWTPPLNGGGELVAPPRNGKGQPGTAAAGDGSVYDLAVTGGGAMLHAAGSFANLGGRGGLLTLDLLSGSATGWQADAGRPVYALAVSVGGRYLYAAAGGEGGRLFAFDAGAATAPVWEVKVDGEALGVVATRSSVYLFGDYRRILPAASGCAVDCTEGAPRERMASFTAATGELEGWMPATDPSRVASTGTAGVNRLWVGGNFSQVNSRRQPGIALFRGTP